MSTAVLVSALDTAIRIRYEPEGSPRSALAIQTPTAERERATGAWHVSSRRGSQVREWRVGAAGVTPLGVLAREAFSWWCLWCDDLVAVCAGDSDELQLLAMPSVVAFVGATPSVTSSAYVVCETDVVIFDVLERQASERRRVALPDVVVGYSVDRGLLVVHLESGESSRIDLLG